MSGIASAPTFEVATREVVAVEHPMVIKNIDKALKTFGSGVEIGRPFKSVSIGVTCITFPRPPSVSLYGNEDYSQSLRTSHSYQLYQSYANRRHSLLIWMTLTDVFRSISAIETP
jgi:hypothetical protein